MPRQLTYKPVAIAVEMAPFAVQLIGIVALLVTARGSVLYSLAACVLSIIWLKVSNNKLPDEFGEMCLRRHLFGKVGEWLNRPDAEKLFDEAQSEHLLIDGSIDNEEYSAVVTAAGLANLLRGVVRFAVCAYMLFVVGESVTVNLLGRNFG